VALATNLGFDVIAEGVETAAQAGFLIAKGVGTMQGYLFSQPVDAAAFGKLLADGV
jgi:EAL domain-containing protein (putative c-di-GMP-specific phosphodiesterase class I)